MVLSSASSRVVEEPFDRNGFVHVESCLSQEELTMAQRQIERYKREIVPELNSSKRTRQSLALVFFSESARRDKEAFGRYQDSVNQQHGENGIR
jgi:hypothetical protein